MMSKIRWAYLCRSGFWSLVCPIDLCVYPSLIPQCLDYCSCEVSLHILYFILCCQDCFSYSGTCTFPYKFCIVYSYKTPCLDFRNCIKHIGKWRIIDIFTMLSLELNMPFYFLAILWFLSLEFHHFNIQILYMFIPKYCIFKSNG